VDIKRRVRNLVRKYKTNCPFEIASYLNINVRFRSLPESIRGFYFRARRRRFIVINDDLSYEWQRFVCAHEIGHDRLHRGFLGYYFIEQHTLFNPGKFERQANLFAVQLMTAFSEIKEHETLECFYARNGVPQEMLGKF
jgi:Zn-dependent peptidase ImmA (M78 family)